MAACVSCNMCFVCYSFSLHLFPHIRQHVSLNGAIEGNKWVPCAPHSGFRRSLGWQLQGMPFISVASLHFNEELDTLLSWAFCEGSKYLKAPPPFRTLELPPMENIPNPPWKNFKSMFVHLFIYLNLFIIIIYLFIYCCLFNRGQ